MASLPPQRAAPRHTSPDRVQIESSTGTTAAAAPSRSQEQQETTLQQQDLITSKPERPALTHQDTDVKKCWICFADETEDTPETSEWRAPCPCALVAHEDCLLDWIADMESPTSRKRSITPPKLLCPQCKSEIRLARPWNPLVELVKSLDRISTKIITPCVLMGAASTISQAFALHGVHSIFATFGQHDAIAILDPYLNPTSFHEVFDLRASLHQLAAHWRLHVGLPLITPMLILSRATVADSLLPVLPIVFFATQADANVDPSDALHWPPSAALTFAVLPYIRGIYNAYYTRVWAPHAARWAREIQPRQNTEDTPAPAEGQEAAPAPAQQEDEGIFEIRVDGNLWNDWGNDEEEQPAQVAAEAQVEAAAGEPAVAPPLDQPPQDEVAPAPAADRERRLSISTTGLAERVLGALLFPSIAGASGELLKYCLPGPWTKGSNNLLGRKWGRSVVGGCLFVVLKDAVMLYVRWKMARQHAERRVLDYKGKDRRIRR